MKRLLVSALAVAVLAGAAGCASSSSRVALTPVDAHVKVPADKPPSPATWPKYPRFSPHSCWVRPFIDGVVPRVEQVAPSYAPGARPRPLAPASVARRLLARFGDRRFVHSIVFSPAPPAVGHRIHVIYWGGHPPADMLQAKIVASAGGRLDTNIATWEAGLVGGALLDDMCAAGGAPLVTWSSSGPTDAGGMASSVFALGQRFPSPSPTAFRKRVALVGRRYGFRVASLRLLHPQQLAPLLIVKTSRNRKAFVKDIPAIMALLDPTNSTKHETAQTFEGFFFGAEDAKGLFVDTQYLDRSEGEGGEWSWNPCAYPYATLGGPIGGKCG